MSMHFINLMYSVTPTTLRGSHTDRRQWFLTRLTSLVTDSCFECSLDAHGATVTAVLKAWITFWKRLSYINLKHFNILIEDFMNADRCISIERWRLLHGYMGELCILLPQRAFPVSVVFRVGSTWLTLGTSLIRIVESNRPWRASFRCA